MKPKIKNKNLVIITKKRSKVTDTENKLVVITGNVGSGNMRVRAGQANYWA